jgi:hypothetical protein
MTFDAKPRPSRRVRTESLPCRWAAGRHPLDPPTTFVCVQDRPKEASRTGARGQLDPHDKGERPTLYACQLTSR